MAMLNLYVCSPASPVPVLVPAMFGVSLRVVSARVEGTVEAMGEAVSAMVCLFACL